VTPHWELKLGILEHLKGWVAGGSGNPDAGSGETETVRKIVQELDSLEPERARWVASFAYLLGRAAHADLDISEVETSKMESLVAEVAGVGREHSVLVVQIAKTQHRLFGGTENFLVTREFREISSRDERLELLRCLFAVSAADDSISNAEESQIRQVASELGLSHRQYVDVRAEFSGQRELLKGLKQKEDRSEDQTTD